MNLKYIPFIILVLNLNLEITNADESIKEPDAHFEKSGISQIALGVQDIVVAALFFKIINNAPKPVGKAEKLIKAAHDAEFEYRRAAQVMKSSENLIENLRVTVVETSKRVQGGTSVPDLAKNFNQLGQVGRNGAQFLSHPVMTAQEVKNKKLAFESARRELNTLIRNGGSLQEVETFMAKTLRVSFNFVKVTGSVVYVGNFAGRVYTYNYLDENPSFHPVGAWAWKNVLTPTGEYIKEGIEIQLEDSNAMASLKEWIPSTDWLEVNWDESVPTVDDYEKLLQK